MSCDIIIPVFNQKQYTQNSLVSIKKNTRPGCRIIIVDDKSNDPDSVKFLSDIEDKNIKIIRNGQNLGWVKSVNRGLAESSAEYVCVMNNDTLVTDGWLDEMIAVAEKEPDIGLVNPVWEKPDNISIEKFANGLRRHLGKYIETDWVRGFCFLIKREVINRIGGLDEAYSPGYYDDCDYSVRALRAGFRPVRAKASYVYHYQNATHKTALKKEGMDYLLVKHKELFYERWGRPLKIVFIFSGKTCDKKKIEDMLFSLARQQHHIYIWAINKYIPPIEHTNVKVNLIPAFLFSLFTFLNIINNLGRNINKRYDLIFTDDVKLINLFLFFGLTKKVKIFLEDFDNPVVNSRIKNYIEDVKNERKIDGSNIN